MLVDNYNVKTQHVKRRKPLFTWLTVPPAETYYTENNFDVSCINYYGGKSFVRIFLLYGKLRYISLVWRTLLLVLPNIYVCKEMVFTNGLKNRIPFHRRLSSSKTSFVVEIEEFIGNILQCKRTSGMRLKCLTLSTPRATIVAISRLVEKVPSLELLHATESSVRLV